VEQVPIVGREDSDGFFEQFLARYDAPAYIRRARQVQDALDQLVSRCRRQREEWLALVRTRLGLLQARAGDWARLRPWLADDAQLDVLRQLHAALEPRLRAPMAPTSSPRVLRRALRELRDSLERFNRRWREFLPTVDRSTVNALREGYNRYYLLEKECAVRSVRVARQGFHPLGPLTTDELAALLPALPVPRLKE
jgi:hypothetical protein